MNLSTEGGPIYVGVDCNWGRYLQKRLLSNSKVKMCTFPPLFSLSEWVTFVGCGHFVECKLYHSGTVSQLIGRFQMTSDDDNGPKRPPKVT